MRPFCHFEHTPLGNTIWQLTNVLKNSRQRVTWLVELWLSVQEETQAETHTHTHTHTHTFDFCECVHLVKRFTKLIQGFWFQCINLLSLTSGDDVRTSNILLGYLIYFTLARQLLIKWKVVPIAPFGQIDYIQWHFYCVHQISKLVQIDSTFNHTFRHTLYLV